MRPNIHVVWPYQPVACRGGGGGGGWHGPRAQALEGAPAQLVWPNCKNKIRPRQLSKVNSLQRAVADAGSTKRRGGGAHSEPRRRQPHRPMRQGVGVGVLIRGGRCKHWPPGAGDPRYATYCSAPSAEQTVWLKKYPPPPCSSNGPPLGKVVVPFIQHPAGTFLYSCLGQTGTNYSPDEKYSIRAYMEIIGCGKNITLGGNLPHRWGKLPPC